MVAGGQRRQGRGQDGNRLSVLECGIGREEGIGVGWTDGQTDRQVDGWTDGRMDTRTDRQTGSVKGGSSCRVDSVWFGLS